MDIPQSQLVQKVFLKLLIVTVISMDFMLSMIHSGMVVTAIGKPPYFFPRGLLKLPY